VQLKRLTDGGFDVSKSFTIARFRMGNNLPFRTIRY
jgi:hypothetical protein